MTQRIDVNSQQIRKAIALGNVNKLSFKIIYADDIEEGEHTPEDIQLTIENVDPDIAQNLCLLLGDDKDILVGLRMENGDAYAEEGKLSVFGLKNIRKLAEVGIEVPGKDVLFPDLHKGFSERER